MKVFFIKFFFSVLVKAPFCLDLGPVGVASRVSKALYHGEKGRWIKITVYEPILENTFQGGNGCSYWKSVYSEWGNFTLAVLGTLNDPSLLWVIIKCIWLKAMINIIFQSNFDYFFTVCLFRLFFLNPAGIPTTCMFKLKCFSTAKVLWKP